ncbi:CheR family methyltransferase [Treponema sp. R80B11-R83G3]
MPLNAAASDNAVEVPPEILCDPALLFLYYRIEQILGIRAGSESLIKLNEYLENNCGSSFIKNPAAYEYLLTSREQIFSISKFLTVNETYFFREGAHFDLLAGVLPELAELGRPLQICSAAVSIGCEAYSIAMLLDYHIKNGLNFDFTIDAFDVSVDAIETAKNARYTSNALRSDGSSWKHILDSYLIHDNNEFIVSQNIRRKVRFFPHNIMRGLEKQYDIIFFRNSLIYFSNKNRIFVINNLAESLFSNGLLFMGISETSAVRHPLLTNKNSSDVFYFQKTGTPFIYDQLGTYNNLTEPYASNNYQNKKQDKPAVEKHTRHIQPRREEISVSCAEITEILKTEDGKPNAEKTLNALTNEYFSALSGGALAASAIYFLNTQDLENADTIISYLEKNNSGAFTKFLRGEHYFHRNILQEAEKFYVESSVKDKYFWPAFYRIAVIASEGNPTRYEYKIKKTIESIELLQNLEPNGERNYECFMGGFSPDYFLRILEKKLS